MASVNGYVSESELGSYLSINDGHDDALIGDAITSMSRVIDDRCGRRFYLDGIGHVEPQRPRSADIGEVEGRKGGVDSADK